MYALSVTFHFGPEVRDGLRRIRSYQKELEGMPGLISVEAYAQENNQFVAVSKWESFEVAQSALGAPGVNAQLARRIGIVIEHPEATEMFSA